MNEQEQPFEQQINNLTKNISQQIDMAGGRMLTLLSAATAGQKVLNKVVAELDKQTMQTRASLPEEFRISMPKQWYSVVKGAGGKTKLQITIQVEETLAALEEAKTKINLALDLQMKQMKKQEEEIPSPILSSPLVDNVS